MARFVISLSFAALVLGVLLVSPVAHAQNQASEKQLDPNAQCDQTTRDQITSCLDQIEQDESKLPSGPCSSSDWTCICTKQVGLQDCYQKCRGLQPVDDVNFNKGNCFNQHGVDMSALTYSWSQLPFAVDSGASRNQDTSSGGTPSNSNASGSTSSVSSSTSLPSSTAPTSSSISSNNASAATSSPAASRTNTSDSTVSNLLPDSHSVLGLTSVLGALLLGTAVL
ncbi:hypothetical protein FA10DRAFT_265889 [Acaromyces ingoldii]|uniref:Extracellular membrane protein CFEM domain-containing protein n=1 Tax=Acaromyces ingoldii TaxID=215250 RepID=A0A316YSS8_9BASI|nr:hypothetical protein FA10DRAFT_265889 [Acaromyces ingoldii]PWN92086.1 hypothetical protein FA10DRAFT_265889 [Acaromyces ingoldii]